MKKLMIIVPNLRLGGQERVAVNTAEIMLEEYEVTLVLFDNSEPAFDFKGRLIDIKVPAKPGKIAKIINVINRVLKVSKLKRALGIDYCISFGESANIVNVLSKGRTKVITSIRGYANLSAGGKDSFIYRHSDRVICCSKEIKARYDKLFDGLDNAVALYNPYDVERIKFLGKEEVKDVIFEPNTIITHGRLEKVKNYTRLIKAFSIVNDNIPSSCLLIIGEGSERLRLENLVKKFKLEKSVRLIGFRKNPFAYIAKATLYVLSSLNEGFPNALVEGMVFLPAVAVDCKTGPREIFDNEVGGEQCTGIEETKHGILVKQTKTLEESDIIEEDDKKLAEAIMRIIEDKKMLKKYREASAKRIEEFSFEHYKGELIKILEEIE